ncbi:acetylxylan esterase [uncultured Cyclobacterium sp.]|uniref:alpha/beta hydrolase family protein n=1 Tax=uncultured Cyclobacterium sp. TaxID=453820 RepID=UPI0030EBCE87|tara:strand:+ start:125152 stop:127248 length:2097 start_codon:yes stop_codon:yes gene_type:complete
MKNIPLTLLLFLGLSTIGFAQEDLTVIQSHWVNFTDGPNALYKHQSQQALEMLEKREKAISSISSLNEWKDWQATAKDKLMEVVGPFPEKTPLNPKVTAKHKGDGYKLENIVFESRPGFYVSGTLFIPDGVKGKTPTIIYCSGHTPLAYRAPTYQHVILNLVKKGFVVFGFDPVGQGERLEYFDHETNKDLVGGPTKQHSYPGAQAFVAGSSEARHMIWDGIRVVDYLLTRKEVDPERIGITGRSGGGTQSSYIAAFDERINASAPENYITNFKRLMLTHGPQDAEQNFYHAIAEGLDHPDLMIVRAPKPNLLISTTRDMFNIEGVRETSKQVQRIYDAYGVSENFQKIEDDDGHASTKKNRERMYAFFRKHLDLPGPVEDQDIDTLDMEVLQVSPTGQLVTSYNGKTTFELNKEGLQELKGSLKEKVAWAKKLSGYQKPGKLSETMMVGRFQRDGYTIEKHLLKGEGDYWLPYLLMKPDHATDKAVLYLDPSGKAVDAGVGGDMETLVKAGAMVLAPDLLNTGEMGNGGFRGDANFDGNSYNLWFESILIGRSIVGIDAGDANRLVAILQEKEGAREVKGIAKGEMSSVLLHAANFNTSLSSIALIDPMSSYRGIVASHKYNTSEINYSVAGALKHYDLPDLLENLSNTNPLVLHENTEIEKEFSLLPERGGIDKIKSHAVKNANDRKAYLTKWLNP